MINNIKIFKEIGIYDCPCSPYLTNGKYCDKCIEALVNEINTNGFQRLEEGIKK